MRGDKRRITLRYGFVLLLSTLLETAGVMATQAGDVVGSVKIVGEAPAADMRHASVDQAVCGAEPRPSEALAVSPAGGVRNAVVFVAHERLEGWRSPTTFQMDQRRCTFVPHVLIIPPGATVEVLNSDGILHNFHTLGRLNPSLNLAQWAKAKPLRVTFEHPEIVQVKCDVHGDGFMRAWIVVAAHPYYALTDEGGRFRLADVPMGPHTLEVWHERVGTKRVPISVGASGEVSVSVTFGRTEEMPRP